MTGSAWIQDRPARTALLASRDPPARAAPFTSRDPPARVEWGLYKMHTLISPWTPATTAGDGLRLPPAGRGPVGVAPDTAVRRGNREWELGEEASWNAGQ